MFKYRTLILANGCLDIILIILSNFHSIFPSMLWLGSTPYQSNKFNYSKTSEAFASLLGCLFALDLRVSALSLIELRCTDNK